MGQIWQCESFFEQRVGEGGLERGEVKKGFLQGFSVIGVDDYKGEGEGEEYL